MTTHGWSRNTGFPEVDHEPQSWFAALWAVTCLHLPRGGGDRPTCLSMIRTELLIFKRNTPYAGVLGRERHELYNLRIINVLKLHKKLEF